jgi:mono/diheme cytochrome c family protein
VKHCPKIEIAVAFAAFAVSGCRYEPAPADSYSVSERVSHLSPKFMSEIRSILIERCGTPVAPIFLGEYKRSTPRMKLGAAVYERNCLQCHGVSGDGNGPAAIYMLPRPRDYRMALFKFTSTTYGSKPLREDLVRTVRRGIAGTSMPSFRLLPQHELDAVVDYVLALTHRGELESQLADAAEFDGQIDYLAIPAMIRSILGRWDDARKNVVYPLTPIPVFSADYTAKGKVAFLSKGCSKCHGDDGRGQTKENIGNDAWGWPTKAGDLSSGMLRGGTEPLDIYRHISAGINGTPMPAFSSALEKEPDTMWQLTAYVLSLTNVRRNGAVPEAGILKPLPGVEAKPVDDASASNAFEMLPHAVVTRGSIQTPARSQAN